MKLKLLFTSILVIFGCVNQTKENHVPKAGSEKNTMEISKGFQVEHPDIFVPWGISEKKLEELFEGHKLNRITNGYYVMECTSLNGLVCMLGFHFNPNVNGTLNELEFFRMNYDNQQKSFDEFQQYFTNYFGSPTTTTQGSEGFNDYEWQIENIHILHYVYNRFGPEEHMSIIKK